MKRKFQIATCIATIGTEFDLCKAERLESAQSDSTDCAETNATEYDACVNTANSTLGTCEATATLSYDDSVGGGCLQTAFDQHDENMNTAMGQFNDMMALVTNLQNHPIPSMQVYAPMLETIALCNYMNNIQVAMQIYSDAQSDCLNSKDIAIAACGDVHSDHLEVCAAFLDDSGCNDYLPPDYSECDTYQSDGNTACDDQYVTDMDLCTANSVAGDTACENAHTLAMSECLEILDGLDCSSCQDPDKKDCLTACHEQWGEGSGEE